MARNKQKGSIVIFWMKLGKTDDNGEDISVYIVEIPAREQNTPEVNEAKRKEIENLKNYDVFEEVDDLRQERRGSRWGVTQNEKADGQKAQIKGRLVAKGFQEEESPQ